MDPVVSAPTAVPPSPQVVQPAPQAFVPVAPQIPTPTAQSNAPLINAFQQPADTVPPAPQQVAPQSIDSVGAPAPVASQTDALAQPLAQSVATVPEPQQISVSGKSKEAGAVSQEVSNFVEVVGNDSLEKEPLPPEVSSWMEKVNRDSGQDKLPEVVVADKTAQSPTGNYASDPVFVLPLGQVQLQNGLHTGVESSVRWLSEWCKRVMKRFNGQTAYSES